MLLCHKTRSCCSWCCQSVLTFLKRPFPLTFEHCWVDSLPLLIGQCVNRYDCDWLQCSSLHALHRALTQKHTGEFESRCLSADSYVYIYQASADRCGFQMFRVLLCEHSVKSVKWWSWWPITGISIERVFTMANQLCLKIRSTVLKC